MMVSFYIFFNKRKIGKEVMKMYLNNMKES